MTESDTPQGTAEDARHPLGDLDLDDFTYGSGPGPEPDEDEEHPEGEATGEPGEAEARRRAADRKDGEEDAEEADADDEDPQEDDEADPRAAVVVKLPDGTEIPAEEAAKGYLRQSDYSRKTQELAHERRILEGARSQHAQAEQEARQLLDVAITVLRQSMPQPPDPALMRQDIVAYTERKHAHDMAVQQLQQLVGQRAWAEQAAQLRRHEASRTEMGKIRQAELGRLYESEPDLRNRASFEAFVKEAFDKGAKHYGLTAEEVSSLIDHRQVRILRDALRYRSLQAKRMETVRQAKTAPARPSRPSARGPQTPAQMRSTKQQKALLERARATGRPEDIALTLPDF